MPTLKKKLKNISLLFIFLFSICGCAEKNYELTFKKKLILDYHSNDSPLLLIDKIGDVKVTKEMIKNNKIEIGNFTVECATLSTDKLGIYDVKYTTNDTENRFHTKTIKIEDISSPIIKLKKKSVTMTLEEYKKYDFSTIIIVSDNWEKDDVVVNLAADRISKDGTYDINVTANDNAGNIASAKISLTIKSEYKKKEDVTTQKEFNNTPNKDQSTKTSLKEESQNKNPTVKPPIKLPKPTNRDYLFINGYTMDNVEGVCNSALESSGYSGTCKPIRDENGFYGMRLIFK